MAFLSFISPFLVYFAGPVWVFFLGAFVVYNTIYFLDVLDGEVARLRKKISKLGEIFDATLWFYLPILYIVYLYKLQLFFSFDHLIIFALMSISTVVMSGILRRTYTKKTYGKEERRYFDFKTVAIFALRFSMSQSAIFIIAPVIYYLKMDMIYLLLYIYFSLSLYMINSLHRFYGLVMEYYEQ
jgi:phosphatidylglycerophosphate synthase